MKHLFSLLLFLIHFSLQAQTGSEIYLFDLQYKNNSFSLSKPVNITLHKGYDNQPFFHPTLPLVYYASANDSGRTDIKSYNYKKGISRQITTTTEREYSPTITPDGRFISCIIQRDNGNQDLGKYPINGGQPTVLIHDLKVGYHTWTDPAHLLLFVLADTTNNLHYYDLDTKKSIILGSKPGRSLHKIPGGNTFSFIDKTAETWLIKEFNPATGEITPIVATMGKSEDIAWTPNGYILTSDGEKLFAFKPQPGSVWQEINTTHLPGSGRITRMAVNKAHTKLALVISE
jgi:hypothetical protein